VSPSSTPAGTGRSWAANDYYLSLLLFALLGYALFGRGFAYVGVPPLFIGEMLMVLGLFALLHSGAVLAALGSFVGLWLILFWCARCLTSESMASTRCVIR